MKTLSTKLKPQAPDHSSRAHAVLGASGSSRWINCTPSAQLEQQVPGNTTSVYAEEGTLAHEISELYISNEVLGTLSDSQLNEEMDRMMSHELFSNEMLDEIPKYTDYVRAQALEARCNDKCAVVEIEQRLDLTDFVPESFGTADCVVISNDTLEVIDLKYGKGVPVYADHNTQLMLYGLGAYSKYSILFDIKTVKLTICQPRLNNISSWSISVDDLLAWANNVLVPAAKAAYNGEGQQKAGPWCRFCRVRMKCRAQAEEQLSIAKHEFRDPMLLSDEEIADILSRAPQLVEWANSVAAYALDEAVTNGKVWKGYKLVEGISRRKWVSEEKVISEIFRRMPDADESEVFDTKLKSISSLEKQFGKANVNSALGDLIIKPQGKPTLVRMDDKRPSIGIESAIQDFS